MPSHQQVESSAVSLFDRRRTPRERRNARRAPFVASVRSSANATREELALAVDLSETGMRLRRVGDAPNAGLIHLEFELPDGGAPILASGRLLFDADDGSYRMTGVRFIGLDEEEAARIASYVAVNAVD
jgi:PilZ domain